MGIEEKAKAYDEALKDMMVIYPNLKGDAKLAVEHAFPELRESEDERIRIELLKDIPNVFPYEKAFRYIHWLEKQKEQPKEELVYRLNGLMQEYIKEGKDEAEKEHRFKCYQLFWDALEDTSYFEQKEQKPAERIEDSVKFEEGFKAGRESGLRDGQKYVLNNLDSYGLCKPAEWSEEDERRIDAICELLENTSAIRPNYSHRKLIIWLKSLHPQPHWKPSEEQPEVDLKKAAMHVYESWMGGTMDDVRRDMVELGRVLIARKV